jgi:2-dehydropantoate 2-reductase
MFLSLSILFLSIPSLYSPTSPAASQLVPGRMHRSLSTCNARAFKLSFSALSPLANRLRPRLVSLGPPLSSSSWPGRSTVRHSVRALMQSSTTATSPPTEEKEKEKEKEKAKAKEAPAAPPPAPDSPSSAPEPPSAAFYRTTPPLDPRIHILGVGNVGRFVAHALRGIPRPPPVTLLLPRSGMLRQWEESPRRLVVHTEGESEARGGFDAEVAAPRIRVHGREIDSDPCPGESNEPINSLIVANKTPSVLQYLSAVKHRLNPRSVICFLQNGMGLIERVNAEIFPDPETRPYYMIGINSHGLSSVSGDPFATTHAGFGTISLSIMPHERDRAPAPFEPSPHMSPHPYSSPASKAKSLSANSADALNDLPRPTPATTRWTPNQRYLLRTLLRTPILSATAFSPPDLLQLQLEKLAINCVVNPLTVMLDARNGAILYNFGLTRTMRLLLAEISLVIRSLPELQYMPNLAQRFDAGRLETLVVGVANRTRDNISSMLADVRAGRPTEIDYINGYIVRRGEELGIRCLTNYFLLNLVKGKQNMVSLEKGDALPWVEPKPHESEVTITEQVAGWNGEEKRIETSRALNKREDEETYEERKK